MATPRKRKKTSRDAYLRTWGAEGSAEKADASSLVDEADLPPERPELHVAGKVRRETVVESEPEPEEEEERMPKPGGQASEIHSSTILQAMELRIDSLSEALHRVEKRLAGIERSLEAPVSSRSPQSMTAPVADPMLSPKQAPGAPAPAVNPAAVGSSVGSTWISPRPRRWPIWLVALLLGIVATLFAAYMGVGGAAPVPFADLFNGTAPTPDYETIIDSIDWVAGAIGAGVFLLFGGLITGIRGARYRSRESAGQR